MAQIYNEILVLFLMIGIGYLISKLNIIDGRMNKGISKLLVNVTLPLLIFSSFTTQYKGNVFVNMFQLFIYSNIIFLMCTIGGKFLSNRMNVSKKDVFHFILIFSNCGFVGFPVVKSIYGDLGVLYTSVFNVTYNIFIWTVGVMIYTKGKESTDIKKIAKNPNIIAVFLGVSMMALSVELPVYISKTASMVGSVTTPLSMISIGAMLSEISLGKILKDWTIYYLSFLRLLVIPLIGYAGLRLFHIDMVIVNVITICLAMPAASLGAILAESYNNNARYASVCVLVSTLFSIITIPFVTSLIMY
ncbi:MAG: AEC family transporter [Thermotaleaceae bacterium]